MPANKKIYNRRYYLKRQLKGIARIVKQHRTIYLPAGADQGTVKEYANQYCTEFGYQVQLEVPT